MNHNDSFEPKQNQPDVEISSVKGTGFSPYIDSTESTRALAPEGRTSDISHDASIEPAAENPPQPFPNNFPIEITSSNSPDDHPLFHSFSQPEPVAPTRIPHLGHIAFLAVLAFAALLGASLLTQLALHYHLFGIFTAADALTDIHYTLGSMAVLYLLTFIASFLLFPLFWHKSLFAGLQWNGATALHLRQRLVGMAIACFILAIINGLLLPGPNDTPIDKMFRTPGAAWLLFGFGVTLAPFFEEIVFRGFLLPALATACDWIAERATGKPTREPDKHGHPFWSFPAMAIASILTSLPFALMHAEQTGYSIGPFLMLIGVSLVLCWVRLSTRSLAASVLVHACYNFMLFSLMLLGTQGFQHLNKM